MDDVYRSGYNLAMSIKLAKSIKLVSVNIEGQKHLDKVRTFLARENADIVCMQECFGDTITDLVGETYPYRLYMPTYMVDQTEEGQVPSLIRHWGEVILSKYPLENMRAEYLVMEGYSQTKLPVHGSENHLPVLLVASVLVGGHVYRVGTTHMTWTPGGTITQRQRDHVAQLLALTKGEDLVFAGDFNIPRGNAMYQILAARYKDNIPAEIETTLDPTLHYANKVGHGKLKLVVDYVWSTPIYQVDDIRVVMGVSDHCGLVIAINLNR